MAPALQAHALLRAWTSLGLSGVLFVGGQPTVYFKEVAEIEAHEIRDLCGKLWNHGVAPILIVISNTTVQVYSSLALPPNQKEELSARNRLVDQFNRVAQALEVRQLARRIELGEFFGQYPKSFNPKHRVDRYLLDNLDAARAQLEATGKVKIGTKTVLAILGRTIFTCYLVDRGIIGEGYFATVGAENIERLQDLFTAYSDEDAIRLLYALFKQLKSDFNGDLFQGDLDAECATVTTDHIAILRRFLNGDSLRTGQASLGFWPYDFGIIPIETVSAIYETFLEIEDAKSKRAVGAYYTPRFLAEILIDTALAGWSTVLDKRFLDPACGSGIFLVGLFNRMAMEWRRRNPKADEHQRAEALIGILRNNLYGVDISETACRIAAFSLYLAFLDQLDPRDIQTLQAKGSFLPTLVLGKDQQLGDPEAGSNILCRDFFEDNIPLPVAPFDLTLGNPPWVKAPKSRMVEWCRTHGKLPIAQGQLSHGFLWKAPGHVKEGAPVCFAVPAGVLLNHQAKALAFQRDWLQTYSVDRVINLADLRFFLFEHAIRPALVVKLRRQKPDVSTARIDYVVPKADYETIRAEILTISPDDQVRVRLREVIADLQHNEPPLVWSERLWGTPRDTRFLDRLKDYRQLGDLTRGPRGKGGRWVFGEGFNTLGKGEPREHKVLREVRFLPSNNLGRYIVHQSSTRKTPRTYTPRYLGKEAIFRAPHVLFPHGASTSGERIKVAFAPFDCSFEHSIRGIHGPAEDEDRLRFLACVLASPLALYFFFHTSANWGSERAKIHVAEYERFPFPPADSGARRKAFTAVIELHREMELLLVGDEPFTQHRVDDLQTRIDALVYEYYDIDDLEAALIDDTVRVSIPSATPARGTKCIPTLSRSTRDARRDYVELLLRVLNGWAARGDYQLDAQVIIAAESGAGIVVLRRTRERSTITAEHEAEADVDAVIRRIRLALPHTSGSISYLRDLKILLDDELYLLKPLSRRYWTPTSALNDADEIAAAILGRNRGM